MYHFFLFLSLFVLVFSPMPQLISSSETKLFELNSLPHDYLTFLGDSHFYYGANVNAIALTKEGMPTDAPRSTGMVLYNRPILFLDPQSKKVLSFSTMFAFSIKNMYGNREDSGDGLAFLISPDDDVLGSPGYLGLIDSTYPTRNKFIAIEFDTRSDPVFQDPDDNHLGLDINSLSSVQIATSSSLDSLGVNLKSGDLVRTWIDYKSNDKRMEVFLTKSDLKPTKPLLKVDIDLSNYLKENMFVGFSAATQGSMQLTHIEHWEFTIVEFSPPTPPSPSPESGTTFPNSSQSGHKHSHLSRLAIGLTFGICFIPSVVVFCWLCRKKLMGMIQKFEGTNNLDMQSIRALTGTSEIRLSIPSTNPHEVAKDVIIQKVLDNETGLRVKTLKFSIPNTET